MIDFQAPELSDKAWIDPLLAAADQRGCEYNFTNIFAWSAVYDQKVARLGDLFLQRLCGSLGCSYLFPVGRGDVTVGVDALAAERRPCGSPLRLVCITPAQRKLLEEYYPGYFTFQKDRPGFDYLYDVNRLADLPGKPLHDKRTHVNHFVADYPHWSYEEITGENLSECLAMDEEWYRRKSAGGEDAALGAEGKVLRLAMAHYEGLRLEGGLLRVDGQVVAFAMGDRLNSDTYDVHFEKAFSTMRGAYAMMNREFARWVRVRYPSVKYLNREDDMGVDGLRQAKKSYYPDGMVEKYSAVAE